MLRKPPAALAAACGHSLVALCALAFAASAALAGCSAPAPAAGRHAEPEWRLVPEGAALGKRSQFFLYGRHLDSVRLSAPPSVVVEKGEVMPGGKALSLYLTIHPFSGASPAKGEERGAREIEAKTPDTALAFKLKIVDELVPR